MITIDQIKNIVVGVAPHVEIESIKNDVPLSEYEIDSLDIFSINLELQELAGFEVPDEDVDQLNSVNSINEYFKKQSSTS